MRNFCIQIIAGILGIWLAVNFIPGVTFDREIKTILSVGLLLGFLNFFIKPILEKITFPLRVITLNLFTLVIMMGLVWLTDIVFPESRFEILGITPLFLTSIDVWFVSLLLSFICPDRKSGS
jgi:putative membrane protein